jgi:hypothetical protein
MSAFLPAGYQVPEAPSTGGLYMKLQPGENKFRILSAPLTGWVYWTKADKSIRLRNVCGYTPYNIRGINQFGNPEKVKHFWAMLIWNLSTSSVQVLEITQVTIQQAIANLSMDDEWGDPREYGLKIVKSGKDQSTEYTVIPTRPTPPPAEALAALEQKPMELLGLYFNVTPGTENWQVEARNNIYARISEYAEYGTANGIAMPPSPDYDNAKLSELLNYAETLLQVVSTTAPSTPQPETDLF